MRRFQLHSVFAAGALALASSCVAPPLESPPTVVSQQTTVRVQQGMKNKVDVLFMIDNSNSMEAMSVELRARFDQFFKVFSALSMMGQNADLNIGIVTSDYGAGRTGAPGCQPSPGGQQGRLQALGAAAPNGCQPPTQGKNFIHYNFANNGMDNNLPSNQNLVQTFTCMASVGASGCGFEHQLESVYAALHNNLPENHDFLRPDALLAVVFLTNEDDSSAPPDSDMFDKNQTATYGYESSYRQTRWGIMCDPGGMSPPPYGDSGGALSNCVAATNPPGHEYDISRYIDLFTKPKSAGGVKESPSDVILFGIDAPETPVQIILSNPGTMGGSPYTQCPQLNESSNPPCVPVLQHSCQNPIKPVFFGDPAVRLNTVIKSAKGGSKISSICDMDYSGALQTLGKLIVSSIGAGCITSKLPDPTNPDCVVEDVTDQGDGTSVTTEIPRCDKANGAFPCWTGTVKASCSGQSPDSIGIDINRNGMSVSPSTTARVSCSTIAQ